MADEENDDYYPLDGNARAGAASEDLGRRCPYLSTVDRKSLDFDMEKVCSVTLSPQHVYCCLVCGKYFRGRGKQTPAYTHAVQDLHHVFMNMEDGRFFCLPDGYEIHDASLDDIKVALMPKFDPSALASLDSSAVMSTDAHGRPYLPGLVGMNDLNHTDYISASVQALSHVPPFRDFFLDQSNTVHSASALVRRFGELLRRLWSPRALKCVVSPHDFLNTVSEASNRQYGVGKAAEAVEFVTWLLNTLHRDLLTDQARAAGKAGQGAGAGASSSSAAGLKRPRPGPDSDSTIVTRTFGGEVEVTLLSSELEDERAKDEEERIRRAAAEAERNGEADEDPAVRRRQLEAAIAKVKPVFPRVSTSRFLILSLDLPPAPLFRQGEGGVAIPQLPVYALLSKFDGVTATESLKGQYRERRKYRLLSMPRYLLLAVKRFKRNAFFTERNPTVVTFPTSNLEMRPYMGSALGNSSGSSNSGAGAGAGASSSAVASSASSATDASALPSDEEVDGMSVAALKGLAVLLAARYRVQAGSASSSGGAALEKGELVSQVKTALSTARARLANATKFDLVSNMVHEVQANADAVAGTANAVGAAAASSGSGAAVAAAAAAMMSSTKNSHQEAAIVAAGAKANENQAAAAVRLAAAISDPILRGKHKVHVQGGGGWYEIQDSHVAEALPQLIGVSDTVLMVYARRA